MLKKNTNYVMFCVNDDLYSYVERLDTVINIAAFSDNSESKFGKHLMGDDRICISPENISSIENCFVIICSKNTKTIHEIEEQMNEKKIPHATISEFMKNIECKEISVKWPQQINRDKVKKFIEILVHGTTFCNLHCDYCYVWKKKDFTYERKSSDYSPYMFRKALSQKRLGGICHINLCALGETLFAENIEEYVFELADEGHYISIITNGTITTVIKKICEFPIEIQKHIFFKLSFHYAELIKKNLYEKFWESVEIIKSSFCSFTIEITPSDLIIDSIDEIRKEFKDKADGAMPHITFTRDATKKGLDLYSELSLDKYRQIWGQFNSALFDLKSTLYKRKISEDCYAGCWSYRVNLVNGNLQGCYEKKLSGTIFDAPEKPLPLLTVKNNCSLDYCFNNHAFIGWGDVPEIKCCNYLDMRDRVCNNNTHWIKNSYAHIMEQKLYDNNFCYINRWKDYEELFDQDREAAFILFNSPEYGNLGDQAIAYAERVFFEGLFPEKKFIEISCTEYIKENMLIKNAIRNDDVILLSGGGYLGSLWKWLEDLSINIISNFPENKIIILPQTIFFTDNKEGEYEKRLFAKVISSHKDITLFVRDKKSVNVLKNMNFNNYILSPDMVLSLNLSKYCKTANEQKALICMRADQEILTNYNAGEFENILSSNGFKVEYISTTISCEINQYNRLSELEKIWNKISEASIVVTDRLHMAIFCCLLGVKCIAVNNLTGKVFDYIDTWGQEYYLLKCENGDLKKSLSDISNINHVSDIKDKYYYMKKYLKESCFKK